MASRKLTRGNRNINWIEEYCFIPEGKFVGRPVRLTSKQKKWVRLIYDSPTRTFILSMGRKNAKTAFSAFLVLLHTAGPEAKPNSQLYSAAQSRDQASILFNLAAKIIRMSPGLLGVMAIKEAAKELICPELGTKYKALSAEASTSYGLSPAMIVHDELGQVKGPRSELYEALETASAAQESPLSIIISTQARTDADLLSTLIDDALGDADPKVKCILYCAPKEDEKPFGIAAIRLANPHLDNFMNKVEVKRQADEAKRMPARESAYRNLILNQRVEAKNPFISQKVWTDNGRMVLSKLAGATVFGGLDLSSTSDLTSLELVSDNGGGYDVHSIFWLPEEGLEDKSAADRVPYDLWSQQGFIETTPGRAIEYEYVATYLRNIFDICDVQAIAFDRYNMRFLKPWLVKAKFTEAEMEKFDNFGQGFVSMSPALRELESQLLNKRLRHGNNPVLTMCAANAAVVTDPAGNRKFTKSKSSGRIDGMVSLAMAIDRAVASEGKMDINDFLNNPIAL